MFYNIFAHFFAKKFAHVKKKQYLCTRNRKDMLHLPPVNVPGNAGERPARDTRR